MLLRDCRISNAVRCVPPQNKPTPQEIAACRRFLGRLAEDSLPLERWAAFRLADQRVKGLDLEARLDGHQGLLSRLRALAAAAPPLAVRDLALDGAALM